MSADPTPVPDTPQPPAASASETPAAPQPPVAPASATSAPQPPVAPAVPVQYRTTLRKGGNRLTGGRSDHLVPKRKPRGPLDPGLVAIGAQLRALLGGLIPLPPTDEAEAAEQAVTAKNRRFAAKSSAPPVARAALPAALETAERTAPASTLPSAGIAADPVSLDPSAPKIAGPAFSPDAKAGTAAEKANLEEFRGQRRARKRQVRNSIITACVVVGSLMLLSFFIGRHSVEAPAPVVFATPAPGGKAAKPTRSRRTWLLGRRKP